LELDIASHPKFVLDRTPEIVEVEVEAVDCIHRSVGRSMVGAGVGCIHRSVGRSMAEVRAGVAVGAAGVRVVHKGGVEVHKGGVDWDRDIGCRPKSVLDHTLEIVEVELVHPTVCIAANRSPTWFHLGTPYISVVYVIIK